MVIIVNMDRVVYELDLQSLELEDSILATNESITSPHRPYCYSKYQISRNGSQIVGLYIKCPEWSEINTCDDAEEHSAAMGIRKTRLELKMFDLSGTAVQVQILELEYVDPQPPTFHMHVITFSPDLSIVQAGTQIFDLLTPGRPPLSFSENPLDRPRQGESSSITFSPCNRYLIIINIKDDLTTDEFATYGIFRVYRAVGRIEKVAIPGLDVLVAHGLSAHFHPELPLLVLTCFTRPESIQDCAHPIKAIEIDLEALKHTPINIPNHLIDSDYR